MDTSNNKVSSDLGSTTSIHYKFWSEFIDVAFNDSLFKSYFKKRNPWDRPYYDLFWELSGIHLCLRHNLRDKVLTIEIYIENNDSLFNYMLDNRSEIEDRYGYPLEFEAIKDEKGKARKACKIYDRLNYEDIDEISIWNSHITWFINNSIKMKETCDDMVVKFNDSIASIEVKEWIIPCNVAHYDIVSAFNELQNIEWKQSCNINVGDVVYIYIGNPYKEIKYKCIAAKVDLPVAGRIDDSKFIKDDSNYGNYGRYMELQLIKEYKEHELTLNVLRENEIKTVQGPRKITEKLSNYIKSIEDESKIDYVEIDYEDLQSDEELAEGEKILKIIEVKKRNAKARKLKLESFKRDKGKLYCEVCGIEDEVVLDIHHDKVTVAEMEEGHVTKLEDLRVICANCHRKVHGYKIMVDELIKIGELIG